MSNNRRVIKNGYIITPNSVLDKNYYLVLKGNKIDRIGREENNYPPNAEIIDAGGMYISPGFIDMHIHGGIGYKLSDGTHEAVERIALNLAKYGTTGFLATIEPDLKIIENLVKNIDESVKGARILGFNSEGPFLNPIKIGALEPEYLSECKSDYLLELIAASSGMLKMMVIAPELPGAEKIIKMLNIRNIVPAMGHTDADYCQVVESSKWGIRYVTHCYNTMRGLKHREPGSVGAALVCDELACEIIADGIHVHPAAIKLLIKSKPRDKVILVTDANPNAGLANKEDFSIEQRCFDKNLETELASKTLGGSTLFLNQALKNIIEYGELNLPEGVRMGTLNPALVLGLSSRKGTLEAGKDADIVFFDGDYNVHFTMVEGEIVYQNKNRC